MTWRIHHPVFLFSLILGSGALFRNTLVAASAEVQPTSASGTELFASGVIPRLRIELDSAAVVRLRQKPRSFVAAKVSEGNRVHTQVALRLKGSVGSFRTIDDKPSMTLDFSRFSRGGDFHGLRRVHLNNSVEDPSYANEKLGSEVFAAAGIPSPRVTRALVELNGRALGPYVLKEGFTEDFLAAHFQHISGDLYEPGVGHDVNERLKRNSVAAPFDKDQKAVLNLAAAALEPDLTKRWKALEATLDTGRFVPFMALEAMLGHRDGYCLARNNFRLYHDLDKGRMVVFPHGMDQLFGTAELPWQPRWSGLVAKAVIGTPEGKERYAAAFKSLFNSVFKGEALTNRVDELVQELRPALDRGEWVKVSEAAGVLKEQIARRQHNLELQLNGPVRQPLAFVGGVGQPEGWEIAEEPPEGKMERTTVEGRLALHIAARADTAASWRTVVLLTRGQYRFEGQARIAGVRPLPYGTHHGAGLRIGGSLRQERSLVGDASWQKLKADFGVGAPEEEVELVCELRAHAGEAWFDLGSLRVIRMNDL